MAAEGTKATTTTPAIAEMKTLDTSGSHMCVGPFGISPAAATTSVEPAVTTVTTMTPPPLTLSLSGVAFASAVHKVVPGAAATSAIRSNMDAYVAYFKKRIIEHRDANPAPELDIWARAYTLVDNFASWPDRKFVQLNAAEIRIVETATGMKIVFFPERVGSYCDKDIGCPAYYTVYLFEAPNHA